MVLAVSSTGEIARIAEPPLHHRLRGDGHARARAAGRGLAAGDPRRRAGRRLVSRRQGSGGLPRGRQPEPGRVSRRQGPLRGGGLGARRPRFAGRPAARVRRLCAARQQRRPPQDRGHERQAAARRAHGEGRRNARLVCEGGRGVVRANQRRRADQRRLRRRQGPPRLDLAAGVARGSLARRARVAHRVDRPPRARRVRPRRNAAQPHGAQLVVSERHLPRRQHRPLLRADPPAARRLRAQARRLARGAPGRRRGLRIFAGRPVRADGQAARAPADHSRPDGRGRIEEPRRRQHHLCLGQLVPGRKANPGQRPGGRQGRRRACSSWTCRVARRSRSLRKGSRSSVSPSPPTAGPSWPGEPDGRVAIYAADGSGEPRPVPGLEPEETPLRWTADGRSIYVTRFSALPGSHRPRGHHHRAAGRSGRNSSPSTRAASSRPARR